MSIPAKRSIQDREISPPASIRRSKRRRLSASQDRSTVSSQDHSTPPSPESITLYSWNVNGIAPFLQPSVASYFKPSDGKDAGQGTARASLRDFLRRHAWPTILFLQEVKINPEDIKTMRAVEKAVARQTTEPADAYDYKVHFCLPSDKFNARGFGRKVYGVCSIVRADFSERYVDKVRPVSWDAEGRFLVIETKATERMPKLAFINVYAVNGTDNPYKDPEAGEVVGTRHVNIARSRIDGHPNLRTFPKQHCLNRADFEAKFFPDSTKQHKMPAESAAASVKDVKTKGGALGMIDTFRYLHPEQKSYTYYPRSKTFGDSCDRVDMILVSEALKGNLREAGMHETPSERGPSDHVPLYVRLDFHDGTVDSS
ncbi:hypothetical protein LTR37_019513 [Vermiconidia calcicola]|uniref:Uncharacterized protein n=1 Tax=Vermiconidia calcicola TaxID=1690605 RepID=A0ACC3MF12_9PEZI|nr:hypothetical protein LTR37_019513 [Vermiconidia calcicola]